MKLSKIISTTALFTAFTILIVLYGNALAFASQSSDMQQNVQLIENKTVLYVPLRELANFFGYEISWNGTTSEITLSKETYKVELRLNRKFVLVNGSVKILVNPIISIENKSCISVEDLSKIGISGTVQDGKFIFNTEVKTVSPDDMNSLFPYYDYTGTVKGKCTMYESMGSNAITTIPSGAKVNIYRDYGSSWYKVNYNNTTGWIRVGNLNVNTEFYCNKNTVSNEDVEFFFNRSAFTSNTSYLVYVDIGRQKIYIGKKVNNSWIVIKNVSCATGKNETPTIRGTFTFTGNDLSQFSAGANGIKVINASNFYPRYYIHSVILDRRGNVYDGTLGKPASHGCIRTAVENSKWIYTNIKSGTKLIIR